MYYYAYVNPIIYVWIFILRTQLVQDKRKTDDTQRANERKVKTNLKCNIAWTSNDKSIVVNEIKQICWEKQKTQFEWNEMFRKNILVDLK